MRTVAHLTDLHLDDPMAARFGIDTRAQLLRVLADLQKRGIREVKITGDMGEPQAVAWLFSQIRSHHLHASLILGNHDDPESYRAHPSTKAHFHENLCYHAKACDGFLMIHLDSHTGELGELQRHWLERQLSATTLPLMVFIHHPILDCGNTPMDRLFPLRDRTAVQASLRLYGKSVSIFCGHYHADHFIEVDMIRQLVTPSTYAQLKTGGDTLEMDDTGFGYRLLTFGEGTLETTLVRFPSPVPSPTDGMVK